MSGAEHILQVQGLAKRYPSSSGSPAVPVFENVDFTIARGEFVCIIGHSGCGKTTILNVLAGLESASSGFVFMDGREVNGPGLERGVVFQGHALMPWMTVLGNVAFAVRSRWPDWSKAKVEAHCRRFIELVGLAGAEHKKPAELSGGMKQRVGIARAFSIEPKMLLLDEPFGALDAFTREELWCILRDLWTEQRFNVILVTHDLRESVFLADTVYVMSKSPGRFVVQRSIDLPRPRDLELTYTKEFTDIVHELRSHIGAIRQTPRSTADRELV
jgi:ABC-type nitrate/sulfonate/bicarbonate transport system ATPase subunit